MRVIATPGPERSEGPDVCWAQIRSTKSEIRNNSEGPKKKAQNAEGGGPVSCFPLWVLNLFRISCFGFRICPQGIRAFAALRTRRGWKRLLGGDGRVVPAMLLLVSLTGCATRSRQPVLPIASEPEPTTPATQAVAVVEVPTAATLS